MDFEGPTAWDLANIHAINRSYFYATRQGGGSRRPLRDTQISRLCRAPLLLFSLREHDQDFWASTLAADGQGDLLEHEPETAICRVQAAALAFLWQLSRRNPYVARMVCAAPVSWCESLASTTLVRLLACAATCPDLIEPRFEEQDPIWQRLIQSGIDSRRQLQRMSQQLALQAMLMRNQPVPYGRLPAAACRLPAPVQRVAEHGQLRRRKV